MFVKQTSGFAAMKFVNFIAHYIMGKKKLKSLSARCSFIGYGNCFASIRKSAFYVKKTLSQLDQLYKM